MSVKNVLTPFAKLIPQNSFLNWTGRQTIFPYYHTISNIDLPYISNLYPLKSVDQFEKEVDYFCRFFEPVPIEEAYFRFTNPSNNIKPAFHLTFDDGLKEMFTIVGPILEKRGIPATFFLNTAFIGNENLFYRYKVALIIDSLKTSNEQTVQTVKKLLQASENWHQDIKASLLNLSFQDKWVIEQIAAIVGLDFEEWLQKNKPYMDSDQVRNLIQRGFTIGSHSVDHPRFRNISLDSQRSQFHNSFEYLEKQFELRERYFSFPFGDEKVRAEYFDWMNRDANCKLSFGVSGIKDDYSKNHIHRIPMDECLSDVEGFIKSEFAYYILKGIVGKNKIKRH